MIKLIMRKKDLAHVILVMIVYIIGNLPLLAKEKSQLSVVDGLKEREYLVNTLIRIANPVLEALSKNQLKERLPVECAPNQEADRKNYIDLEVLGRTLAGMAAWMELGPDGSSKGKLREKYILLSLQSIRNATDPKSVDYMNFTKGTQPLVDAAFLSQARLRAPNQLWGRLSAQDRCQIIPSIRLV